MGVSPPFNFESVSSGQVIVMSVGLISPLVIFVIPVGIESEVIARDGEGAPRPTMF
jgi:hypothetical protein